MGNADFYRNAKAYDLAFGGRDFSAECDCVEWLFDKHSKIGKVNNKKLIELGSGPARHALEFAKKGWNSTALDLSFDMLEYASLIAKELNLNLNVVCDNMIQYNLPGKVELTTNFTDSITHIITNEQMIEHFRSVAKNTVNGGLYVIETSHPLFFFPDDEENFWISESEDMSVEILFGSPGDEYDSISQQWNVTTQMTIHDKKALRSFFVESYSKHRWYLVQELKTLVELSGVFDGCWFYGNMDIPPNPLDDSPASDCMIIVLRIK